LRHMGAHSKSSLPFFDHCMLIWLVFCPQSF
jgi:hypothetical protein